MGFVLAAVSSLSFVVLDVLRKKLGPRLRATTIVVGINLGAALVMGPVLYFEGVPEWNRTFLLVASVEVITFSAASLLYVQAVTLSPLSLTIPYLAFTPVISAATAALVLAEIPSPKGWIGIVMVVLGALALHVEKGLGLRKLLIAPFREPGSWRMLLVALIFGFTTSLDKIAIRNGSEALLGFVLSFFGAGLVLALDVMMQRGGTISRRNEFAPAAVQPLLYLAALFAGAAVLCQFYAYRELLVSYVETIKRAGGLLSALFGVVYLGEGGLKARLPAAALMVLGILLIAL